MNVLQSSFKSPNEQPNVISNWLALTAEWVSHIPLGFVLLCCLLTSVVPSFASAHKTTLTWTLSTTPGVTYSIYRSNTPGACSQTAKPFVTGVTANTYVDSAVPFGVWYYNVAAVNAKGISCSALEQRCQVFRKVCVAVK
jgi:hypothetical protein